MTCPARVEWLWLQQRHVRGGSGGGGEVGAEIGAARRGVRWRLRLRFGSILLLLHLVAPHGAMVVDMK